jgi:CsoR family transcriptional regulator, copper-sensing transcriptional repressor
MSESKYMDMNNSKTHKQQVLHRIKIIEGHLKAIEKMIENDTYCVDIMNQSLAVQKALHNLDMAIMENHLNTCVVEQVQKGEQEKMVKDMLGLYKYI